MTRDDARTRYPILCLFLFNGAHLPPRIEIVSRHFRDLAYTLAAGDDERGPAPLPEGPDVDVMLRKLLEAKDAAVRALL